MTEKEGAEPTGPLSSFIKSLRIRKAKQEACSRKELVFGFSYLSPHQVVLPTVKPRVETQMCCLLPQAAQAGH